VDVGDAYLRLTSDSGDHLWFVCTQPNGAGEIVVFNLTTRQSWAKDLTCILKPGEHPFVVRESIVYYQRGLLLPVSKVQAGIARGTCKTRPPGSPALMQKIREGALQSAFTAKKLQAAIRGCPWAP